ncbi:MAG: hypothetical protein ACLUEQ_07940 [Cloacibacillus evryensis]
MRHDMELSKVMKRLVTAVIFICGAAGYQFSLPILKENWWLLDVPYPPDRDQRFYRTAVSSLRLYSCTFVLVGINKIRQFSKPKYRM